jgi:hypothetical protein
VALPSPPQNEPKDYKDAKNAIVRDSLFKVIKKGYDRRNDPNENKPRKESLLNSTVINTDTAYQIWQYPY